MKVFGQIVRTLVNVALLPVAAVKDAGRLMSDPIRIIDDGDSALRKQIEILKDEADEY